MAGIKDIAKAVGVDQNVVVDVFEAIFKYLKAGENVRIYGFGTFERRKFPGRTLESPVINDGKPMTFKPSYRLAFRQSGLLKRRLNIKKKKGKKKAVSKKKVVKKIVKRKGKGSRK